MFYIKCLFVFVILGGVGVFFWQNSFSNLGSKSKEYLPGVQDYPSNVLKLIEKKRKMLGASYTPRTRHVDKSGKALFTNRLFLENSPYLLQHAHNPVNWYPWSEEAFKEARKRNIPILLSVGYSTCHWCHVMEEESFEDLEIARYLNAHYIAIKIDREERPDIDAVYMSVVQMMTGGGGWPMTVWLTSDKNPFYGGTYFPARDGDRGSRVGFLSLLKKFYQIHQEKSEDIAKQGVQIKQMVQKMLDPVESKTNLIPSKEVFQILYQQIKVRTDTKYGGLKGAPKFPSSFPTRFLLRSYLKTKDENILKLVQITLNGMQQGGIRDHIGGGFHRYSVDEKWLVPHFEKMLYDQALLALAYLEAYQLLGDASYKKTAEGILDYIRRDMQAKEGGFYSATDADSLKPSLDNKQKAEKVEGYYFTWTPKEIDAALSPEQAELIKKYYGVKESGQLEGRSILHISDSLDPKERASILQAEQSLKLARWALLVARNLKPLPLKDEKILTAWNALMISAFVKGYVALNNREYLVQAEKAAAFLCSKMFVKGELRRSWKNGQAYIAAYLDDYAFFISALLDLFEVSGELHWLEKAIQLDQILAKNFEDKNRGGFFMTAHHYETLMAREKPLYDGAEPSGNAIAVLNLLRLGHFTTDSTYRKRAQRAIRTAGSALSRSPLAFSEWMQALDFYHSKVFEIVLILPDSIHWWQDVLLKEIRQWYVPHSVLIVARQSDVQKSQTLLPTLRAKKAIGGKSTVYICEEGACQLPAMDLKILREQLQDIQSATYL